MRILLSLHIPGPGDPAAPTRRHNQQKVLLYSSLKVLFRKSQESPWRQPEPRLHSQHSSPSPDPSMEHPAPGTPRTSRGTRRVHQPSRARRGPRTTTPPPPAPAGPHTAHLGQPRLCPGAAADPSPAHTMGIPRRAPPARAPRRGLPGVTGAYRGLLAPSGSRSAWEPQPRAGEGLRRGLGKVPLKKFPS